MFQKIVERLLNKILGEYVEDFNSQNLKIGLWSGQVVLRDVKIKKDAIKKLNLPFKLRYSKLRCLKMNIPWSSIASSKIQVLIEGLQILISEVHPSKWQLKNQKIITLRKQQIKAFSQSIINDFAEKAKKQNAKPQQQEGYFSGLVVKIIDNLQVTIKDIHIRYEDQIYNEYSFGATLEELKIFTVNENDQPIFIDRTKREFKNQPLRKRLVMSNFGIYWNQKSTFFDEEMMGEELKKTIARKTDPNTNGMNYIILMSFQARLLQRQKGQQFTDPQIDFFLDFDQLKIQISNKQLQQIVNMGQRLQTFSTQVKRKNKVKISKEQTQQNMNFFKQIYPKFYKNQTISTPDMQKFQDLLQKMEVEIFKPLIKKYLQDIQKQRIMKEKKQKSRGWFSGPKELTEEEKKQIEDFLHNNFGQEVKTVTRPKDFFYTRVNLRLKVLQVVISNSQKNFKEGIRTRLLYIGMQFKLRETGYWLEFGIKDIYVDLFKQIKGSNEQSKEFLRKLVEDEEKGQSVEYVRLIVEGSPIDRPYADTYIKLKTEQLLVLFDPKIINIATNFANIKINAENSSAALQKYGEIKEKTANSVNETLDSKKKSFIYIDIKLKSITAILYFDPSKPQQDIWAITLGQTKIYTDKETLKKTQAKPDQPTQKYLMQLNKISFRYFENFQIFMDKRLNGNLDTEVRLQDVLTNLNIEVTLSMFKQNTTQIPKVYALAQMSQFSTNLTAFTYSNLQKMGGCFVDKQSQKIQIQKRSQQKTQILKNAKKIGNIYIEDSIMTKTWKHYIAILSDNYLYMYNDKKDINYVYYYYVRNSEIKVVEKPDPKGKQLSFHLKNKVSNVVLGFEKKQTMDDWMELIKKCKDQHDDSLPDLALSKNNTSKESNGQDKAKNDNTKSEVNPNSLNFVVGMKIQAITIKTYLNLEQEDPQIVQIKLTKMNLKVNLHQKKTVVKLSLLSIDLKDNILKYKMASLQKLLETDITSQTEKLIDIKVTLTDEKHPEYQYTDTEIDVSFGKLVINYKAETIRGVMKFFLPPPNNDKKIQQSTKIDEQPTQDSLGSKVAIRSAVFAQKMQKFSLKVHLKMAQIAVKLINTKTRVFFAQISMENFQMMFGISDIRMVITGGLQQLSLKDYSSYPETILEEQQTYDNFKYLMTSQKRKRTLENNQNEIPHLIFFDVNMLNKSNEKGKKMLIEAQINDLEVSYIQQPVLRLITYLNTQLLPSFSPEPSETGMRTSANIQKSKLQKQKEMQEKDKLNSKEPQLNTMQLKVTVTNINVVLQPRNPLKQSMKLNIMYLTVQNDSIYRQYLQNTKEKVLVENYDIRLTDMSIFVSYPHPKTNQRRSYKLTPDIDFTLNVDMIQNPMYYEKTYGKDFLDGMRIKVWMSNFFMRINHEDYNFMMKCLYWNITYDDNAEIYLFEAPEQSPQEKNRQIPPLYFDLRIQSVSLFIIEDKLPLAFLLLNSLDYKFIKAGPNSMFMRLDVEDMIGSSLVHKENNKSYEKGMFNNFGYEKQLKTDELRDLDKLLTFFQRKNQIETGDKKNKKKVIIFEMDTDAENNSFMCVKVQQLNIVVEMKTLLVLSQLALMETYIQPPKPKLQPLISEEEKQRKKEQQKQLKELNKPKSGKSQIYIELRDFLASLSDFKNQNFFTMDGQILGKLITYPSQTDDEVVKLSKFARQPTFLQHSNYGFELKNFSIFYSNIANIKKKRFILKPFSIILSMIKNYELVKGQKQPNKDLVREQLREEEDEKKVLLKKGKQESRLSSGYGYNFGYQAHDRKEENKKKQQDKQKEPPKPTKPAEDVIVLLSDIQTTIDNLIFQASIKDIIKINEIIQQNLSNMKSGQGEQKKVQAKVNEKKNQTKQKVKGKIQEKQKEKLDEQQLVVERTKTTLQKPILQKMKAKIDLNPIQLMIINDCDQNFMPVLKFIIQKTTPTFESDIVQGRLNLILTFGLSFFNPRSSKWQPVIETYSAVFDYLNLIGQKHNVTKMFLTNSVVSELKQLKINVSTQFIASLMTTLQKSKEQQKMIKSAKQISLKEEVQVSPFIFQNITNKPITIRRKILNNQNDFILKPMFRGTVRLTEDAQNLEFLIGQSTKVFKVSLEHYGVININSTFYYIEFKVDKLNRIIRFLSDTIIQNELTHTLYVKRYFKNGNVDIQDLVIEKKQMLALDGVKDLQISFNQKSYSEKANINNIKALHESAAVRAQNGKFLLWITKKSLTNQFTTLQIWPPLLIYNCLPKQFTIQFIVGGKVHTKDIHSQTSHQVNANIDFYQLKCSINLPGFYWSPHFQMKEDIIGKEMELKLKDIDKDDRSSTINYIFSRTERGYSLILYCKAFLISQLEDDILAYGNLADDQASKRPEKYVVLGGQRVKSDKHDDDVVIIGSEFGTKLRICGDGCMIDFSQPFSLGGIGLTQNRRIVIKREYNGKKIDLFTTIGVDVAIKKMFKNQNIFSKMVTIHSRAIIINNTNQNFKLREQGSLRQIFTIGSNERKNLYFTMPQNPERPRGMIFRTDESNPSIPISIHELGMVYFKVNNKNTHEDQFYKIFIQQVSKYIFYEITQLTQETIPYQIENRMPRSKVLIKFNNISLSQGEKFSFINESFKEEHMITLRISHESSRQPIDITVRPDDLNFLYRQSMEIFIGGMKGTVHCEARVEFDDKKKYIIIDEVSRNLGYNDDEDAEEQEYQISTMNIKLEKITFSFIQNHISINKPFESFCFFLQGIQLFNEQTNLQSTFQVKLNFLQFDQQKPFNMPNPVIITPYKMKQFLREQNPKSIFNLYINKNKRFSTNTFINKFEVEFNDIVVKISQYFIDLIMNMSKEFIEVSNYKEEDYRVQRHVDKWNDVDVPKEGAKTFIKHIAIAPFVLEVSAEIKLDQLDTQAFLFFGTILNALGVVITNIDGAPISLDGIVLQDCVDTLAGINQKLMNHYKNTVIKQFYKIFGSLNIIGNPMGLFRNISTGFKDLKDKPSEGLVKGPLQFGKGMVEGTSSLIAHSVGGALNSVSKVTGTISTGLAVLAFDKQFQALREKQKMQKPQHIFQGLQKGGKAVFYGFRQGIKGVFMQPYENTKSEGVIGFFKGTAKGLAGLVIKPVTGVIDFASKTTQGLKNTALYLQDKPNQNRIRYPRVFYTECHIVKQYDEVDSKLNAIINKLRYESKYELSHFIQSYRCDDGRFLLIMQDRVIMIRIEQEKVSWVINMNDLIILDNDSQRKELRVKDSVDHTFAKSDHNIKIEDDFVRGKVVNQIKIMQSEYSSYIKEQRNDFW